MMFPMRLLTYCAAVLHIETAGAKLKRFVSTLTTSTIATPRLDANQIESDVAIRYVAPRCQHSEVPYNSLVALGDIQILFDFPHHIPA